MANGKPAKRVEVQLPYVDEIVVDMTDRKADHGPATLPDLVDSATAVLRLACATGSGPVRVEVVAGNGTRVCLVVEPPRELAAVSDSPRGASPHPDAADAK